MQFLCYKLMNECSKKTREIYVKRALNKGIKNPYKNLTLC